MLDHIYSCVHPLKYYTCTYIYVCSLLHVYLLYTCRNASYIRKSNSLLRGCKQSFTSRIAIYVALCIPIVPINLCMDDTLQNNGLTLKTAHLILYTEVTYLYKFTILKMY